MSKTFNHRIVTDLNTNYSKVNDLKICIHAKIQIFIAKSEILLFRKKMLKQKLKKIQNYSNFKYLNLKYSDFKHELCSNNCKNNFAKFMFKAICIFFAKGFQKSYKIFNSDD